MKSNDDPVQEQRQVKIYVAADEHRVLRVAAAMSDKTLAEFCRDASIAEAKRLTVALEAQLKGDEGKAPKRKP